MVVKLSRRQVGILGAAALAGCGVSAGVDNTQNNLRRAINGSPFSIDPHAAFDDAGSAIVNDLYEGLIGLSAEATPIPGVALRWDVSADGRDYTFYLREDARWSNGDPVTAQDFVYSWRRLVTPDTAATFATMLYRVENAQEIVAGVKPPEALGVGAPDDRTFTVRLTQATPFFLDQVTHYSLMPVHAPSIPADGSNWTLPGQMISNGAFQLADWQRGQSIGLSANPYFRTPPHLDRVEYIVSDDRQVEVLRFRSGELDVTYEIPATQIEWLRERLGDQVRIATRYSTIFLAVNLDDPAMADPGVRKALSMTLERNVIADRIARGGVTPSYGSVPDALAQGRPYRPDHAALPRDVRLETARGLMRAAGYGPERPLELELYYSTNDTDRRIFVAASAMWEDAFVKARIFNVEPRATVDLRRRRAFHLIRIPWVADYPHPYNFLEFLLSNAGGLNFSNYQNPEFDSAMAAGDYERAEAIAMADNPIIPLYTHSSRHLVTDRIEGWIDNPMDIHPSRFIRRLDVTS